MMLSASAPAVVLSRHSREGGNPATLFFPVIPAKAGTHFAFALKSEIKIKMGPSFRWDDGYGEERESHWIPAFAGMTAKEKATS